MPSFCSELTFGDPYEILLRALGSCVMLVTSFVDSKTSQTFQHASPLLRATFQEKQTHHYNRALKWVSDIRKGLRHGLALLIWFQHHHTVEEVREHMTPFSSCSHDCLTRAWNVVWETCKYWLRRNPSHYEDSCSTVFLYFYWPLRFTSDSTMEKLKRKNSPILAKMGMWLRGKVALLIVRRVGLNP